jgi:hypothetical protein
LVYIGGLDKNVRIKKNSIRFLLAWWGAEMRKAFYLFYPIEKLSENITACEHNLVKE